MTDKAGMQLERLKKLGDEPDAIWPPDAAAAFLGVTPGALAKWRSKGVSGGKHGPTFVRIGVRVGYRKAALVRFLRENEHQSTSAETVSKSSPAEPSSPGDGAT